MRLILVRHAEPAESARGRCYGSLDVDLSPAGRAAARELRLPPLAAVYASPRRRALETAAALGVPVALDALRELDFGELEGRTYDEIAAERPELYRAWMETPTAVEFPGGESYAQLRDRVIAAVDELRVRHAGETVAAVTHGGVIRAVLGHVLRMPDDAIFRLEQRYLGISVVEWLGDFALVRQVNGTHYD